MRDFVDPRYAKLDFLAKRRVTVATSVTDRHCMAGALPGWKSHRFRLDPHSSWQRKIVGTALSLPLRSKAAKRCTAACAGLIVRPSLASSNFAHECASVQSKPQRAPIELSDAAESMRSSCSQVASEKDFASGRKPATGGGDVTSWYALSMTSLPSAFAFEALAAQRARAAGSKSSALRPQLR